MALVVIQLVANLTALEVVQSDNLNTLGVTPSVGSIVVCAGTAGTVVVDVGGIVRQIYG